MHHLPAHPIARLVFVTLLVLSWTVGLSSAPVASANVTWSIDQLASAALASLKADYDVLITGQLPARPLVSRVDAFKQVRNPSQHFQNILARRSANASYGLTFTEVVVSLSDFDIVINGSELRLAATEKFALGFQSTQYAHDPARDRTLGTDRHTFVFSANPGGWMLVRDELAAFPLNQSGDPIPVPDRTANVQSPTSRSSGGPRFAAPLTAGWYDWIAAQNYIRQYAINYNTAYRVFYDVGGDCTNFVSQVMKAGGWVDRPGFYLDWNNWWYLVSPPNQTRSWTYTHAFQQFFSTSGRGQFLPYLSDLWIGDVIQIDFFADGSIDHSMAVDDKQSSTPSGIFVSYHSTGQSSNRYHEPLSDVLSRNPIPGNNYWAEHVIGTNP